MFSKENRIRKNREIEQVLKKGKGFSADLLLLKQLKNNLEINRFAFIVSRKVAKKANIRNKIKRRLREAVRSKMETLKPGFDNLFIALAGLEKKDFQEIKQIVEELLKKAKNSKC